MVISTALHLPNITSIIISVILAFVFGYALSLFSLLRHGVALKKAMATVLAADTLSIVSMEITDNLVLVLIPGALDAMLTDWLFWASLAFSLVVAFIVTVPVNRALLARGKGHALMHEHHHRH